jgi:hypothetical protein
MQNNLAAKRIFDSWLEPLANSECGGMSLKESAARTTFRSTRPVSGFYRDQEFPQLRRARHTNADLADAVKVEHLRQSAVVMAVVAWQAAMVNEKISRRR